MWEGYELPGAAGAAEAGDGGGGGGAEAVGEGLTPAALMESNVISLKAGMSSGLQEKTYKQINHVHSLILLNCLFMTKPQTLTFLL